VQGAQTTGGMDEAAAQQVWDLMAAFASYGFPKAHAAGYAAVAYRMAYLKTHYPAEFMAARLAVYGGFYRQNVYMSEARHLGLRVMPPHVNHSQEAFTLEMPDTLWMGLGQVRDVTHHTLKRILQQRPFTSLQDFLIRASPQYVEAVNLVKAGALHGLGHAKTMLAQLDAERWHGRHSEQLRLLAPQENSFTTEPTAPERAVWEREVLGGLVSVHPLELVSDVLAKHERISSRELASHVGREVTLAGVRLASHRFSSNREPMLLADMQDETGMYQVLWSGAALEKHRALISRREPILLRGRVRTDRQGLVLVSGMAAEELRQ
jgi:DNA polymerase III alpha subunit